MNDNEASPVRAEDGVAETRLESEARTPVSMPPAEHEPGEQSSAACDDGNHEEDKHQESTMIDVHAPHGGVHTWKDFWIHLGTITLGLLIAISLEQTVGYFHHLHQRHQLEEDLCTEGENNRRHAEIDIALYQKIEAWLVRLQGGVDEVRTSGGKTAFIYPPRPDGIPDSPRYVAYHVLQTEVWTTAKESSLLILLPREEAQLYARMYIQTDQVALTRERTRETGMQQGAFETRFSHGTYPPVIDLSKLTPQQLDEYEKLLADELEAVRIATLRLKIFDAANSYVLSGGRDEVQLRNAILKANMPQ